MTTADAPVLLTPFRTAVGSIGRGFATHTVDALAAPVLAAVAQAVAGAGIPIDDLLLGNCLGPGGNIARVSALRAGLGLNVPAVTVDRQCGSGPDAVPQAAGGSWCSGVGQNRPPLPPGATGHRNRARMSPAIATSEHRLHRWACPTPRWVPPLMRWPRTTQSAENDRMPGQPAPTTVLLARRQAAVLSPRSCR